MSEAVAFAVHFKDIDVVSDAVEQSAGQTIGPVCAGWIGDKVGDINAGLLAAGLVLTAGAALALFQKPLQVDNE